MKDHWPIWITKEKTLEYQFEIFHVPGRRHVGPDATSRYPSSSDTSQDPISLANVSMDIKGAVLTVEVRREILNSLAVIEPIEEDPQVTADKNILY